MSHVVQLEGEINNLSALKAAVEGLGGVMVEEKEYTYEGQSKRHDASFVIRFPSITPEGSYSYAPKEIGVVKDKKKADTFNLAMSPMSGGICKLVGEPIYEGGKTALAPTLMRDYQVHNIVLTARANGHDATISKLENGAYGVTVRQPEYVQAIMRA